MKLLFYNSAADVLLLDIPSTIPNAFAPFFVGEHQSSPHSRSLLPVANWNHLNIDCYAITLPSSGLVSVPHKGLTGQVILSDPDDETVTFFRCVLHVSCIKSLF